ncbi:MAG: c-type cytochrome [Limibacillus sp.]
MSLELNKIAAAVLTGGVIAMGSGFIAHLLVSEDHLEEAVYKPAGMESSGEQMAEAEGPALEPVLPLLAAASVESGESLAKKCTACHAFEEGGPNKVGPGLWGVVGRAMASHEGYSYSDALQNAPDEAWSYSALNAFLANPGEYAPGTKMSFAGIAKVEDRADMIAYLRSLSNDPAPLPSEDEINALTASAEGMAEAAGDAVEGAMEAAGDAVEGAADSMADAAGAMAEGPASGVIALLASADAAAGEKVVKKCAACHSFDEGGPNKVGPGLWDVVGREIASHEGYSYSSALKDKGGTWDYAALAGFLSDPKGWAPGTKMSFAGIKKDEELANLIAYLRSLSNDPEPLPDNAAATPEPSAPAQETAAEDKAAALPPVGSAERTAMVFAEAEKIQRHMENMAELATLQNRMMERERMIEARVLEAEPDRGKLLAQACATCHDWSENGADKIGPNPFGVLGRRIAGLEDYAYSDCSAALAEEPRHLGYWSYQLFDDLLNNPQAFYGRCEQSHPEFAAPEERLALAAYFRLQAERPYRIN